jgi:hypothetical protein
MTTRSYMSRKTLCVLPLSAIEDPDHWRARADYMRRAAKLADGLEAKRRMSKIASGYEELAELTDERLLSAVIALDCPYATLRRFTTVACRDGLS